MVAPRAPHWIRCVLDLCHPYLLPLRQHFLKHVVHASGHTRQVPRRQRCQQSGGVGPAADPHPVDACKQLWRGDGEIRLAHQPPSTGAAGAAGSASPPAPRPRRCRPVRSKGTSEPTPSPTRASSSMEKGFPVLLVQGPQHSGGIGAAAGHPGAHRDALAGWRSPVPGTGRPSVS